jgi:hypothetical protein
VTNRKRRSWSKWTLGISISVLILLGGTYFSTKYFMEKKFYPDPPVAAFTIPKDLAEAQSQDLNYFAHYFDLERSYTPSALLMANEMLEALKLKAGTLSAAEFDLAVGKIVALADNGHSNVFASSRSRRFGRIDIRTTWFGDGLYVTRAVEDHKDLLGARLLSVSGIDAETLNQTFSRYYGGTPPYKRSMSPYFIEAPELLEGAGLPIIAAEATYKFQLREGSLVERILSFGQADPDAIRAFPVDWLFPARRKGEAETWKPAFDEAKDKLPLYLQFHEQAFQRKALPDLDAYYIALRQNYSSDNQSIGKFLRQTLKEVEKSKPKNLVIDMRLNGGGDYTTTAKAMWKLPTLIPDDGRIFLLSSSATFSAGMSSMGFVKEVGGDRVTIVGTEVGDRMQFWSEGRFMTLPNSKVNFRYSTGYVDMKNSCDDYSKCYWLGALYPIEVESLSPDIVVETTFDDYITGRDPVMARVAQELAP